MRYRQLGNSGLTVSEIGFGTWGLGGTSYGRTDDAVSIRALKRAFDLGVTFYDTSDLYGDGHAETVLGRAFEGTIRKSAIIASKGGLLPHDSFEMPYDFSIEYLRKALEASLTRLQTEYLDLYLLHSPDLKTLDREPVLRFLEDLVSSGKIRSFGISVRSPNDGLAIAAGDRVNAMEVNFNLIDQRAQEIGLFTEVSNRSIGLICRTPLCFGFLTGAFNEQSTFEATDHRRHWPKEQLRRWTQAVELFREIYTRLGLTPSQFALAYCLSKTAISTTIPGMLTEEQVTENVGTSGLPALDSETVQNIESIYKSHVFYDPAVKAAAGKNEGAAAN